MKAIIIGGGIGGLASAVRSRLLNEAHFSGVNVGSYRGRRTPRMCAI